MQKHVNLVDLVKSFPTNIFLQNLASIQKRTSPLKFAHLAEKLEKGSVSNLSTKVFSSLDVDALPSAGFTRLSYVPMEPVSPLSGRCFATFPRDLGTVERKREITWNDAVDATKQSRRFFSPE